MRPFPLLAFSLSLVFLLGTASAVDIDACGFTGNQPNRTYDVTQDLSQTGGGTCISIGARNSIVDCHGFSITGDGTTNSRGISFSSSADTVTLVNCDISGFDYGLYIGGESIDASDITLASNNYGVRVYLASDTALSNVNITNSSYGIYVYNSTDTAVSNVAVSDSSYGAYLYLASSTSFTNLTSTNNSSEGFRLYNSSDTSIVDSTLADNSVYDFYQPYSTSASFSCDQALQNVTGSGGRPIGYYNSAENLSGLTFSELVLCGADGSTLSNITVNGSDTLANNGLFVLATDNSTFDNIDSSGNRYGIYFAGSSSNQVSNTTLSQDRYGLYLSQSGSNDFSFVDASNNQLYGVYSTSSSGNTFSDSWFNGNSIRGLYLFNSSNNTFSDSEVSKNSSNGIYAINSFNNLFTGLSVTENRTGMYFNNSPNNSVDNSAFCSNTVADLDCITDDAQTDFSSNSCAVVTGCGAWAVCLPCVSNADPVADAGGPYSITLPSTAVTLDGSGSTDEEDCPAGGYACPLAYAWSVDPLANSAGCDLAAAGVVASIDCVSEGTADLALTVTDLDGATDVSPTVAITVNPAVNEPPVAAAGLDQATLTDVSVSLTGLCDDSDGSVVDCTWGVAPVGCSFDFAEVKAGIDSDSASSSVGVTCSGSPGDVFAFTLTATDNSGDSGTDSMNVTITAVANVPPAADAGADRSSFSGDSVSLTGFCDDDVTVVDCTWGVAPVGCSFDAPEVKAGLGTGSASSSVDATCVGAVGSVFTFSLQAIDNVGAADSDLMTVEIIDVPPPSGSDFGVVSFVIEPSTVLVEGPPVVVEPVLVVGNFGDSGTVSVELEVVDSGGTTVFSASDSGLVAADGSLEFGDSLSFSVSDSWEQGIYSVRASVFDDLVLVGSRSRVLNVNIRNVAVPGFSVLLLPLVGLSVLGFIFFSRKK